MGTRGKIVSVLILLIIAFQIFDSYNKLTSELRNAEVMYLKADIRAMRLRESRDEAYIEGCYRGVDLACNLVTDCDKIELIKQKCFNNE